MRALGAIVTIGVLAIVTACRSKPAPSKGTASASRPLASAKASQTASSALAVVKAPPIASADLGSAPGPLPATSAVPREVRETAVLSLLADPGFVRRAPLVDLEPGREFDWGLRDRLAPFVRVNPIRVKMVESTVDGDLKKDVAQRIIRQNHGRFRLCYEKALADKPELEGRVKIAFTVEPDGTVKRSRDGGSKLADRNVIQCIVDSVVGLHFPSSAGPNKIVHTIDLTLD